jgi:hypothetical protein
LHAVVDGSLYRLPIRAENINAFGSGLSSAASPKIADHTARKKAGL